MKDSQVSIQAVQAEDRFSSSNSQSSAVEGSNQGQLVRLWIKRNEHTRLTKVVFPVPPSPTESDRIRGFKERLDEAN